ncbi:MAG: twin-arginine translocase subunit TatC, partial [Candidatus Altiarchaeota archaeon]|nr:twin-arginine translocase subunit TatC [Candidatus Altiarchaeota archaeon]
MNRKEMPVSGHLSELRKRILVSLSAFIFASIISLPLVPMVLNKIRGDLLDIPLVVLAPQEALMVGLKLSLFLGFILSFPVLVYQLWSFIAPGLIEKEKKILLHILLPS